MLEIEHFLSDDLKVIERRERRNPFHRVRELTRPRLGLLHHHPPGSAARSDALLHHRPTESRAEDLDRDAVLCTGPLPRAHPLQRRQSELPRSEYVVQDGGSTDETVEVLRRYEGSLSRWFSEPDHGQGDAINRGFAHTSGEIMAYLNSDDLLLPGSLAYVAKYFASHPEVDVVYGHRVMIDEHDRQIGSWVLPPHDDEELALLDFVPQETLFWRRNDLGGTPVDRSIPSLRFAIDWDLLLRLREHGARDGAPTPLPRRLPRPRGAEDSDLERPVPDRVRCAAPASTRAGDLP